MAEYPTINGDAPSFADVRSYAHIPGGTTNLMIDYKAISFESSLEVGKQYGPGGRLQRRTSGQLDHAASAEYYMTGHEELIKQLGVAAKALGLQREDGVIQYGLVKFDIQVQWSLPGSDTIYERVIIGARVIKDAESTTEGTDPQTAQLDLSVADIYKLIDGERYALR